MGHVSLRAADVLFALPRPIVTVRAVRAGPQLLAGLEAAGCRVVGPEDAAVPTDLLVAPASAVEQAVRIPADVVLLVGSAHPRALRRAGLSVRRLLVHGALDRPELIVPVDSPAASRLARPQAQGLRPVVRRLRERAFLGALRARLPVDRFATRRSVVTVAARGATRPYLLDELQPPAAPDAAWFLALGQGDDLQRAVLHVADDDPLPRRVVKFSRVPGHRTSFERDRQGLALAADAGPRTSAHAPRWLGSVSVGGRHGSVESAAAGRPLHQLVTPRAGAPAEKLVETIADWIVAMGIETATAPSSLTAERHRLAGGVLPVWSSRGAPPALLDALAPVPGVLQHNDLGTWNILTDGSSFTAVDWESARRPGLPLWDLLYFLGDALARLDGPDAAGDLASSALRVFRGQSPRSAILFRWIRTAVTSLQLPPEAVGPIATLCWLHHGLSAPVRQAALDDASTTGAPGSAAPLGHLARLAAPWLADPALGPSWRAWQASQP